MEAQCSSKVWLTEGLKSTNSLLGHKSSECNANKCQLKTIFLRVKLLLDNTWLEIIF